MWRLKVEEEGLNNCHINPARHTGPQLASGVRRKQEQAMLVSHREQFIFTKTLKTAGTSIESYFEKYCMPNGEWFETHDREEYVSDAGIIGYRGDNPKGRVWFNHMSAKEIYEIVGHDIWSRYYKFTIVRNPFDKLISGFYFRMHRSVINNYDGESDVEHFRRWIKAGEAIIDRDKYLINGEECVDYFIRYENLHEGIAHVCRRLSVPFLPSSIPTFKKGIRSNKYSINDYYDNETIQVVQEKYAWEIQRFGYHFPE